VLDFRFTVQSQSETHVLQQKVWFCLDEILYGQSALICDNYGDHLLNQPEGIDMGTVYHTG
jgi:hypothetical protein